MPTLQQQIDSHKEEFEKGGGQLELINEWTVQAVGANGTQKFRLPTVVEANDHRLPGWFLAGIWDYMGLDDVEEFPDAMHLDGWLFSFAFKNGTWRKNFTTDGQEEL